MLKGPFLNRNWIGSSDDYNSSKIIMVGLPFDGTCSFTPGSRFAPERIRLASWALEEYSPIFDKQLDSVKFFDAGDLEFPFGNTQKTLDIIEENAKEVYKENKIFFGIGGEHLVSYPSVKACHEKYPDLMVIHFDAHTDLREDYLGEKLSHASVMRRITDIIGFENLKQIGIRSGEKDEFDLMKKHNTLITSKNDLLEAIKGKNIFISVDVDVLDTSVMPGTGTQEAGGFTYNELMSWLLLLKNANIVGADVVELAPEIDSSGASLAVATKLIRDLLFIIGE